jgi:hypothetical protein
VRVGNKHVENKGIVKMWCSGEECSGQCMVFGGGLECGGIRLLRECSA